MKLTKHPSSIIFALIILAGSVLPGQNLPSIPLWNIDKLVHISFYAVFAFLLIYEYQRYRPWSFRSHIVMTIAICGGYGLFIEYIQGNFIANRFFDVYDLIANIIGVFVGLAAYSLFNKSRA